MAVARGASQSGRFNGAVDLGPNQALSGSVNPPGEVGARIEGAGSGLAAQLAQLEPGSSSEAAKCTAFACSWVM